MTRIDDLSTGMYVAIIERIEPEAPSFDSYFFTFGGRPKQQLAVGTALKILAIGLPFACVTDGENKYSIDLRTVVLQKIDKRYFEAMVDKGEPLKMAARRRKKKPKPAADSCPRCGYRCVQKLILPGQGIWGYYCKRCDYQGPSLVTDD